MRSIMLCQPQHLHYPLSVYTPEAFEFLKENAGLDDKIYSKEDVLANPAAFADVDYLFATWGFTSMTEEEVIKAFPNVKCLFYGAGSV